MAAMQGNPPQRMTEIMTQQIAIDPEGNYWELYRSIEVQVFISTTSQTSPPSPLPLSFPSLYLNKIIECDKKNAKGTGSSGEMSKEVELAKRLMRENALSSSALFRARRYTVTKEQSGNQNLIISAVKVEAHSLTQNKIRSSSSPGFFPPSFLPPPFSLFFIY